MIITRQCEIARALSGPGWLAFGTESDWLCEMVGDAEPWATHGWWLAVVVGSHYQCGGASSSPYWLALCTHVWLDASGCMVAMSDAELWAARA
jgi:hypothetical protein